LYFVFISIYPNALSIGVAAASRLGLPKLSKKNVIVGWVKIKFEHTALQSRNLPTIIEIELWVGITKIIFFHPNFLRCPPYRLLLSIVKITTTKK
jgi:hypothetical protein